MYALSAEFVGHSKDVRCVSASPTGTVYSGSRDGTIRSWVILQADGKDYSSLLPDVKGGFVTALVVDAQSKDSEKLYAGCQDGKIRCFGLNPSKLTMCLVGHTDTVCKLAIDSDRDILGSASWDKTVRLWRDGECVSVLEGHSLAVWTLAFLPQVEAELLPVVLSGSADKTIQLWQAAKHYKTFSAHTDCVRDVCVIHKHQFLSCGNDGKVIRWNIKTCQVLQTLEQQAYIYSICIIPDEQDCMFATGGEDGALKIWSLDSDRKDPLQTIDLPAQSCWTVTARADGDVVCGSSDGVVRVFTREAKRRATEERQAVFQASVQDYCQTMAASQEIGGIKVSDLPGEEALQKCGDRNGQTKMVRVGRTVKLYEWNSGVGEWTLVGDVMTGTDQAPAAGPGKTFHKGKAYDYVIDVDVADGQPPLKLPFNQGNDPWTAAQAFIDENMLPQDYLSQVAEFIVKNTGGGAGAPMANGQQYVDPFTGQSGYRPGDGQPMDTKI